MSDASAIITIIFSWVFIILVFRWIHKDDDKQAARREEANRHFDAFIKARKEKQNYDNNIFEQYNRSEYEKWELFRLYSDKDNYEAFFKKINEIKAEIAEQERKKHNRRVEHVIIRANQANHQPHSEDVVLKDRSLSLSVLNKKTEPVAYIFIDTETIKVSRKVNEDGTVRPAGNRIVQISWLLVDEEGSIRKEIDALIKPDGYIIPRSFAASHNITTAMALRQGLSAELVMTALLHDIEKADFVVGHNISFDLEVIADTMGHCRLFFDPDEVSTRCTMEAGRDYCEMETDFGYKYPKLQELYHYLFNKPFADSHDANKDVHATMECFFKLKELHIF